MHAHDSIFVLIQGSVAVFFSFFYFKIFLSYIFILFDSEKGKKYSAGILLVKEYVMITDDWSTIYSILFYFILFLFLFFLLYLLNVFIIYHDYSFIYFTFYFY